MGHYRSITVDGVQYKWVVGEVNIVIKGLGVYNKFLNGEEITVEDEDGMPCTSLVVTPKHVRAIIERYVPSTQKSV